MNDANTKYIGRFAPSPTGPLHFGSLVAAVASYLDARAQGGSWLVRIEDVDTTRCKAEFAADILKTIATFGFSWDGEVVFQSRRSARYQSALERLTSRGLTYACACSRKEIADSSMAGIDGPVYPGTCARKGLAVAGNAIRIRTAATAISFVDRVQQCHCQQLDRDIGDFVLKRRDSLFAYQLAVVVDDAEQQVSHVVRGADLLDSTARQIYLQKLLGYPTPSYLHIPVATNSAGQKLSKQNLAQAITDNEACGLLGDALVCLGQQTPVVTPLTPKGLLAAAVSAWDTARIPKQRTCRIS